MVCRRKFSMHVLRHTMATRCIEGGMRPKTLQVILGHANVGITMNLYVDVTEEEKFKEVGKIESALKLCSDLCSKKYRERQKPFPYRDFWAGITGYEIRNRGSSERG